MRGCSQRTPQPASTTARLGFELLHSPSALRGPVGAPWQGRQNNLSWIRLGSTVAAMPGLPSWGKVLSEGRW